VEFLFFDAGPVVPLVITEIFSFVFLLGVNNSKAAFKQSNNPS